MYSGLQTGGQSLVKVPLLTPIAHQAIGSSSIISNLLLKTLTFVSQSDQS